MPESTPYDEERATYPRAALARLVLSADAAEVTDAARALVGTRHDAYTGPGGRASEAGRVVDLAGRLLTSAVVYERERGAAWADIGGYLGLAAEEAERRYAPAVADWHAALAAGRRPELPQAAYDPVRTIARLDRWAYLQPGMNDRLAVSDGLHEYGDDLDDGAAGTDDGDV